MNGYVTSVMRQLPVDVAVNVISTVVIAVAGWLVLILFFAIDRKRLSAFFGITAKQPTLGITLEWRKRSAECCRWSATLWDTSRTAAPF
jgi:hypothetical protein